MPKGENRQQPKADPRGKLVAGRIGSPHGILGWVRVFSHMEDRGRLFDHSPWHLRGSDGVWRAFNLIEGRNHGKALIARLRGIDDRDAAHALLGSDIGIDAEALPIPPDGQYYWRDLIGLAAVNLEGRSLGVVSGIWDCPAQDVLWITGLRRYAIPFVQGVHVIEVDLQAGQLRVDWREEWHQDAD